MKANHCRRKGLTFERSVRWTVALGTSAHCVFCGGPGTHRVPKGGAPPLVIKDKTGQRTRPRVAPRAGAEAALGGIRLPVVVCKQGRQTATVTLRLEDFVALAAQRRDVRTRG